VNLAHHSSILLQEPPPTNRRHNRDGAEYNMARFS